MVRLDSVLQILFCWTFNYSDDTHHHHTYRTGLGKCYSIYIWHLERLEYIYTLYRDINHGTMAPWQSLQNKQTSLRPGPREPAAVELVQTNLGHLVVNRVPVVIESRGLQDDPSRPHHHRHREDPEEQPVQHHRHVLPVLQDLRKERV